MSKETPAGELLPCPFCGSTAEFGRINDAEVGDFGGEFIQCTNHGCATSSMLIFPTMADATPLLVEKWNRRAADRELRQGDAAVLTFAQITSIRQAVDAEYEPILAKMQREHDSAMNERNHARHDQEDSQAALAAKDEDLQAALIVNKRLTETKCMEWNIHEHNALRRRIARLESGEEFQELTAAMAAKDSEIAALTAERDALRKDAEQARAAAPVMYGIQFPSGSFGGYAYRSKTTTEKMAANSHQPNIVVPLYTRAAIAKEAAK